MYMEEKQNTPRTLSEVISVYTAGDALPMHMPGHKRNAKMLPEVLQDCCGLDITEIEGFDNLHHATGLLRGCQARAARLWGTRRSFFLVNGSTCGLLAAIRAQTRPGDTVLVARNCHKAVYHAIELCRLKPIYLFPEVDAASGVAGSIPPAQVKQALDEHPAATLVILTSPTYEGVISDIASIAAAAHRQGVPVLVDEAHGAHLGFSTEFSGEALQAGADIVVMSLHKTLPALTQTALVHVSGDLADVGRLERELSVFETSSPSYILMASIDACVSLLEKQKDALFSNYIRALDELDRQLARLVNLTPLCRGGDESHPAFYGFDRGKVVIGTWRAGLSGTELAGILRGRFHIEVEMASADYILAITSICDTPEMLARFGDALLEIDAGLRRSEATEIYALELMPEVRLPAGEAVFLAGEPVALFRAEGRTSLEYLWAYPPGIPLVVPGEAITAAVLRMIRHMTDAGVEVNASSGDGRVIICAAPNDPIQVWETGENV